LRCSGAPSEPRRRPRRACAQGRIGATTICWRPPTVARHLRPEVTSGSVVVRAPGDAAGAPSPANGTRVPASHLQPSASAYGNAGQVPRHAGTVRQRRTGSGVAGGAGGGGRPGGGDEARHRAEADLAARGRERPSGRAAHPGAVPSSSSGGPTAGPTVEMSRLRQVVAQRMTDSLQVSAS
jgi:pyruvate dehydrogenase E2 component (dihydrolipoamide acetyltransferase)